MASALMLRKYNICISFLLTLLPLPLFFSFLFFLPMIRFSLFLFFLSCYPYHFFFHFSFFFQWSVFPYFFSSYPVSLTTFFVHFSFFFQYDPFFFFPTLFHFYYHSLLCICFLTKLLNKHLTVKNLMCNFFVWSKHRCKFWTYVCCPLKLWQYLSILVWYTEL